MQIVFLKTYEKNYKKLIQKNPHLKSLIEKTLEIFHNNPADYRLQYKKIACKKDKYRYSIRVVNTQYRILMTCKDNFCLLRFLLDHDEYDRKNRDC